MSLSV